MSAEEKHAFHACVLSRLLTHTHTHTTSYLVHCFYLHTHSRTGQLNTCCKGIKVIFSVCVCESVCWPERTQSKKRLSGRDKAACQTLIHHLHSCTTALLVPPGRRSTLLVRQRLCACVSGLDTHKKCRYAGTLEWETN